MAVKCQQMQPSKDTIMTLIHADSRGRISLGKAIQPDRDYRVTTSRHGTVTLEPVTAISDYERAVLANQSLVDALDRALIIPESAFIPASRLPGRRAPEDPTG